MMSPTKNLAVYPAYPRPSPVREGWSMVTTGQLRQPLSLRCDPRPALAPVPTPLLPHCSVCVCTPRPVKIILFEHNAGITG
jgi:hypothetical protein